MTARDERGLVTSLALGLSCVLLVLGALVSAAGGVLVAHRRAAAAADLGALAGATALQRHQDACAAVHRLVARHEAASVRACTVEGQHVRVTVAVDLGRVMGRPVVVAARAHAGPRFTG